MLLAEAGLTYLADWPNDDQPYLMNSGPDGAGDPIVSIPTQSEWDDVQLMWRRRILPQRVPEIVQDAIETLSVDA